MRRDAEGAGKLAWAPGEGRVWTAERERRGTGHRTPEPRGLRQASEAKQIPVGQGPPACAPRSPRGSGPGCS